MIFEFLQAWFLTLLCAVVPLDDVRVRFASGFAFVIRTQMQVREA